MNSKPKDSVMDHDEQMILNLLAAIEDKPNTTQKDLATRLGVAVGVVNSYLKRVIYKGYVKTKNLQRRRLRYLLTPSGIKEKTRLTYEFLQYSYVYIREIRRRTREALTPFAEQGRKRVVFFGSGESAELAYLTVRELGMELVAVIDPSEIGKFCVEHRIEGPAWLANGTAFDVILDLKPPKEQNATREQIQPYLDGEKHQVVTCLW